MLKIRNYEIEHMVDTIVFKMDNDYENAYIKLVHHTYYVEKSITVYVAVVQIKYLFWINSHAYVVVPKLMTSGTTFIIFTTDQKVCDLADDISAYKYCRGKRHTGCDEP